MRAQLLGTLTVSLGHPVDILQTGCNQLVSVFIEFEVEFEFDIISPYVTLSFYKRVKVCVVYITLLAYRSV